MCLRPIIFFAISTGLISCTQIPDLPTTDTEAARNAPFPRLVPIEQLLTNPDSEAPRITQTSIVETEARLARLRNRASGLRGPVIDSATRARMNAAIARAALR